MSKFENHSLKDFQDILGRETATATLDLKLEPTTRHDAQIVKPGLYFNKA